MDGCSKTLCLIHLYFLYLSFLCKVTCIVPNNFPNYLEWMPGSDSVIIANKHLNTAHKHILNCDILFAVDMNGAHRSGKELEEVIDQSTAYRIHIDHHINPMFSCNFCFSETTTTSTCEMVYRFINEYLDDIQSLSKEAAECIYSGIITDTGSLSYSCNHTITYRILEHLISLGVNGEAIHRLIYDNYSTSRLRLLGVALNNLKIMEELETSYMYLSKKELQENEFKPVLRVTISQLWVKCSKCLKTMTTSRLFGTTGRMKTITSKRVPTLKPCTP